MMGLSQGVAEEPVTLDTLKDAGALAARLKKLNDLKDQAKIAYAQAKQEGLAVVEERKKAEELNASTMAALQEINNKEAQILKFKDELNTRGQLLDTREGGLNAREATLEKAEQDLAKETAAKTAALANAEAALAAKAESDKATLAKQLSDKGAALDAAYKAKENDLAKYAAQVRIKEAAADAAQKAADLAKASYEERLAGLRKLVG